jgi:hypothetical protein
MRVSESIYTNLYICTKTHAYECNYIYRHMPSCTHVFITQRMVKCFAFELARQKRTQNRFPVQNKVFWEKSISDEIAARREIASLCSLPSQLKREALYDMLHILTYIQILERALILFEFLVLVGGDFLLCVDKMISIHLNERFSHRVVVGAY